MTAVEWQFEQLFNSFEKFNNGEYTFAQYLSYNLTIFEQAKEIEKQQIIDAHNDGHNYYAEEGIDAKQYYNETFKK